MADSVGVLHPPQSRAVSPQYPKEGSVSQPAEHKYLRENASILDRYSLSLVIILQQVTSIPRVYTDHVSRVGMAEGEGMKSACCVQALHYLIKGT